MTKADIVQAVYSQLGGFSKKEAAELVDQVFDTMKETLGRGEKIKISGFGNFVLRDKRQRQGRNPQTGEPIVITARRVLNFKASQLLKQALNDESPNRPSAPAYPAQHPGQMPRQGYPPSYTGQPAGYPVQGGHHPSYPPQPVQPAAHPQQQPGMPAPPQGYPSPAPNPGPDKGPGSSE